MALEPDEIALSKLFEGMQALNRRYERAFKAVVAALAFAFLFMGIMGYLLWHSETVARTHRAQDAARARHELAVGTRTVALDSCKRQNEHRRVEREILRRSVAATKRFAAAAPQLIPPKALEQQLRELRRDIRALGDADCQRVADLIPIR